MGEEQGYQVRGLPERVEPRGGRATGSGKGKGGELQIDKLQTCTNCGLVLDHSIPTRVTCTAADDRCGSSALLSTGRLQ